MAMKPVAVFVVIAALSLASAAATARTVINPPRSANEQSVNGVAGPPPAKTKGVRREPDRPQQQEVATADDKSSPQPSKKVLKKTRITPPPPLHDPN
jgi:hypothetical protein